MAQAPKLCCPTPAFNALHPHEVPSTSTGIPTTPGYACTNPLFVTSCGPAEPPEDVTLEGQDCEGNPVEASAPPGQIVYAVQAPGTTFKVQLCENPRDTEKVVLCDKTTQHKVAVISDLTDPAAPVVTFWDLNTGAPWAGDIDDLEACSGATLESDPVEMCDAGVEFLRWIVKDNGEPTGQKFDTDLTGAPYTVTDEAGVKTGKCETSCAKAPLGVVTSWAI